MAHKGTFGKKPRLKVLDTREEKKLKPCVYCGHPKLWLKSYGFECCKCKKIQPKNEN